jgi:hypothetical protein
MSLYETTDLPIVPSDTALAAAAVVVRQPVATPTPNQVTKQSCVQNDAARGTLLSIDKK